MDFMHNMEKVSTDGFRFVFGRGMLNFLILFIKRWFTSNEQTNKDLAMKIHNAVKTKCWKMNSVNFFELDDETAFGIMDEIKKQIEMMKKMVKCAKMVIAEAVAGSDYKKDFEEFKMKVNGILKTDATKCAEMKGLKEKFL